MKPASFDYHRPRTLDETLALLERLGEDARILAGGQSLVPAMNMRLATPGALVDINRLPGLDAIRLDGDTLVIGALARLDAVEQSTLVARHAPLIAQAMPHVAHLAIRAQGTVGGSLALADPAAELPACAVALDAVLRTARRGGGRDIPAADFFQGIYTTALAPGEILVEMRVPPARGRQACFEELARRHGDYALVGLAATAQVTRARLTDVRLVFLGVGLTPVRAVRAERALLEAGTDFAAAEARLGEDLDPPSDVHGSAALRLHLARVLLRRAVRRLGGA